MSNIYSLLIWFLPIFICILLVWVFFRYFIRFVKVQEEISDSFKEISQSLSVIAEKYSDEKNIPE